MIANAAREDLVNLVSRLQKALKVNKTPSFAVISHDCGFKANDVQFLQKIGLIAKKHEDDGSVSYLWKGPQQTTKAVDSIIVARRGLPEVKPSVSLTQEKLRIVVDATITLNIHINHY